VSELNKYKKSVNERDSLFKKCTLVLPGGLIYYFFRNEFTDTESITLFIFISALIFNAIYQFFLTIKKDLRLKILGKIEYVLLKCDKELDDIKKFISISSYHYKNKSDQKKMNKAFNKWIVDRYGIFERQCDKIISDFRSLMVQVRIVQENLKNATISYPKFLIIIFLSFILSMVMYFFEFVKTMNLFLISYVSIFIILLLFDYLKDVLELIKLSFITILFIRIILPISKIYFNRQIEKYHQESIK